MTIKQLGGVFGRNPTFNDVTIEGQLTFDGDIDVNSDLKVDGDLEVTGVVDVNGTGLLGTIGDGSFNQSAYLGFQSDRAFFGYDSSQNAIVQSTANKGIVFEVNDNTYGSGSRALHIKSDTDVEVTAGNLIIGTSGKGIDFSATAGTGTSELLDDYEEGIWTPAFSGGDYTFTYNKQKGSYTKIGNRVFIDCVLYVHPTTAPSGTVDGTLAITGLPYAFNKQNDVEVVGGIAHFKQLFMSGIETLAARLSDTATAFNLYDTLATNYPELAYVQASDVVANTRIRIQFSYPTNG